MRLGQERIRSGNYNFAYNYDKNDNRTSTVRNGNTFNYGYGAFNRITFGERVSPNTSGGFVFASYDSNGNPGQMTYPNGTAMSIQYDLKQQVTQMNIGASQIVKNSYDFLKRRYKKEDTAGATQFFVYDGDRMIAETDANKVITTYHIEGIGMIASNADRRFYRENAIGSACAIGHGGGGQESETLYVAYGVERYASGQTALRGPLRFAGRHGYFSNGETGFQTIGQREYIPLLGRFPTQDPIGQLDGFNVYAYSGNNPLGMIDIGGLEKFALWANGGRNSSSDNNSFQSRAWMGAGRSRSYSFANVRQFFDGLDNMSSITRLDIHAHGSVKGIHSGTDGQRITSQHPANGDGFQGVFALAAYIQGHKDKFEKSAVIRIFACNNSRFAQELSAWLGFFGRGDITVIGASDYCAPNSGPVEVYARPALRRVTSEPRRFEHWRNGKLVGTSKRQDYK